MKADNSKNLFVSKKEIFIVCAFVLTFTPFSFRFLTEICGIAVLAMLAIGIVQRRGARLWTGAVILWMISLISPFDFAIRGEKDSKRNIISLVDVNSSLGARIREQRDDVEGVDFIIYDRPSLLIPVRQAVLLTLPIGWSLQTPIINF